MSPEIVQAIEAIAGSCSKLSNENAELRADNERLGKENNELCDRLYESERIREDLERMLGVRREVETDA